VAQHSSVLILGGAALQRCGNRPILNAALQSAEKLGLPCPAPKGASEFKEHYGIAKAMP
jgi:hypothetical protein